MRAIIIVVSFSGRQLSLPKPVRLASVRLPLPAGQAGCGLAGRQGWPGDEPAAAHAQEMSDQRFVRQGVKVNLMRVHREEIA